MVANSESESGLRIGERVDQLPAGLYRLTREVTNRSPDRRIKRDWRMETSWAEGSRFIVSPRHWTRDAEPVLMLRHRNAYSHHEVRLDDEEYSALVLALERISEEPTDFLDRKGWENQAGNVLDRLYADGLITLEQVEAALERVMAE